MPVERNVTIVKQTTNVTNITYSNTTIVNEGPNYDQLRGRSRRPLERLRIERQYDVRRSGRSSTRVVTGGVIAMMAPLFSARKSRERPRNVGAADPAGASVGACGCRGAIRRSRTRAREDESGSDAAAGRAAEDVREAGRGA